VLIGLDAMGTNLSPCPEVEGAITALKASSEDLHIVLFGEKASIESELDKYELPWPTERLSIIHASERVLVEDYPIHQSLLDLKCKKVVN
jgi:fatty acid/phospholipid biosynthesis enzyme